MRLILILSFFVIATLLPFQVQAQAQKPCDCQAIENKILDVRTQMAHRSIFVEMAEAAEKGGSKQDRRNIQNVKLSVVKLQEEIRLAQESAKSCGCE